jgi:hypothetical protein
MILSNNHVAMTVFTKEANEGKLNNVIILNDNVGYTN